VSDDKDLRSRLERIAASAGDPPDHGLERVAACRHRRLRRRRGAVAPAAALAVLVAGAPLIAGGLADDRDTVTASDAASPTGAPVELPRSIVVRCEPTGIVVPVASVRPQRDGLHIRVHNSLPSPTTLEVEGDGWSSGAIPVAPGVEEVRQPVPPGEVTLGCDIGGTLQRRQVNLVDAGSYYEKPELACPGEETATLRDLAVEPAQGNVITAAREALHPHLVEGADDDAIGALRGYPAQRLSDPTADPVVQVVRDGDVIAFAHLRGGDGEAAPPWTTVSEAEVCRSVLDPASAAQAPATASTAPVAGAASPEPP
jgi:hypothetical protein